jgi:branched-chain amino acid transport system ATP-binding protein
VSILLDVQGLSVTYQGSIRALRDVSLQVTQGALVAVLGGNGAGKTTLVRAITGLLFVHRGDVTAGAVRFLGQDLTGATSRRIVRSGICQVPEGRKVFSSMSVEENLLMGASSRSREPSVGSDLLNIYSLFPPLADRRAQKAGNLSGGEQQMLAIGRGLMARPQLLICDEVSLGLAPMVIADLFSILADLNRDRGMAILLAEQNAKRALELCNFAYVLERGRLRLSGPREDLIDRPEMRSLYLGG